MHFLFQDPIPTEAERLHLQIIASSPNAVFSPRTWRVWHAMSGYQDGIVGWMIMLCEKATVAMKTDLDHFVVHLDRDRTLQDNIELAPYVPYKVIFDYR